MSTPFYSFNSSSTSINFAWPEDLTGIERVALASQGDLQRVLSAFFARPIQITPLHTHTRVTLCPGLPDVPLDTSNDGAFARVSPETPITQARQVILQCAGQTVCSATSTVRMTSPHCARLFLVDKFPIGQLFRKLDKLPAFELLAVGFDKAKSNEGETEQLWRKYRLWVDGFETEIKEVFPSRQMFSRGERWLLDEAADNAPLPKTISRLVQLRWFAQRSLAFIVTLLLLFSIPLGYTRTLLLR